MGNFMCICTMYTISRLGLKKKKKKVTGFFPLSLTTLLVLPVLIIGLEIELVKELTNSSWRKITRSETLPANASPNME